MIVARKWAIAIAIALIIPFLVYSGVAVFSVPPVQPKYESYGVGTTDKERQAVTTNNDQLRKDYDLKMRDFNRVLFYAALPVGVLCLISSFLVRISAIASGLVYGGLGTLWYGIAAHWNDSQNTERFVTLLSLLSLLIFLSCARYFRKNMEDRASN